VLTKQESPSWGYFGFRNRLDLVGQRWVDANLVVLTEGLKIKRWGSAGCEEERKGVGAGVANFGGSMWAGF